MWNGFRMWLWVMMLATLSTSCAKYPPDRPRAVPESAKWAGGWDGGSWIDCSLLAKGAYNYCQIFDEGGSLLYASNYRLRNLNRAAVADELRYRYVDGTTILLQAGLALVPITEK
jgi:hypothetical protein